MRENADIVVVGAGIVGACTALALVEHGCGKVVLVDRDDVGAGTTGSGGGFVSLWGAGWVPSWTNELELEKEGLRFYAELAAEDDSFDHRANGALFLSFQEDAHQERLESIAGHAAARGARRVSAEEVEHITQGAVRASAVHGAAYHPTAASVSTLAATRAIARRFQRLGGRIVRGAEVRSILLFGGSVAGVETTTASRIAAETVVVACGAWTNILLDSVGVRLPLVPLASARIITSPAGHPSTLPNILELEHGLWFREHHGGYLWGAHSAASPYKDFVDQQPPPASAVRTWSNDDIEELRALAVTLRDAVPGLAAPVVETTHGLPMYTPDWHPLIGQVAGPAGLHVVAGDNYAGVSHGPGMATLLARTVRGEDTGVTGAAFAADRFGDRYRTGREVLEALRAG